MQKTGRIIATSDHLTRLVGSRPINGLAELVWNSVDADAQRVTIEVHKTPLGAIDRVTVNDDGTGFGEERIKDTFSRVGGSWKRTATERKTTHKKRLLHGEKGQGRWKAFSIGDIVHWDSVTVDDEGNPFRTRVEIYRNQLDSYSWETSSVANVVTGTTVTVEAGMNESCALLGASASTDLTAILALYLSQYPDIEIWFDGTLLEIGRLIARTDEFDLNIETTLGIPKLIVMEWNVPMERALYLCDENGASLHETNVGIKASGFDFTAYIRWSGFREHESLLLLAELDNENLEPVIAEARAALRQHFQARRDEDTKSLVDEWRMEEVYPYDEDATDSVSQAGQALFNYVAVAAASAVNQIEDRQAKRLSLATMKVAIEQDPSSIEFVFREILKLPSDKLEEFRRLLQQTNLTNIVNALRMVTGRLEFLKGLDTLLFDREVAPHMLERAHLQKIVAQQPWIFGERFATHVSDSTLTNLLRSHIGLLKRADLVNEEVVDSEGKRRLVDFMFGRQLELPDGRLEHLVVEIKRPSVTIGRKELAQIEDYAMAVIDDIRFDKVEVRWDFVLLATAFNRKAKLRLGQDELYPNVIYNKDGVRISVRKWSTVLQECNHRLQFVRKKLDYDPTDDDAIRYLKETYPDFIPAALRDI